MGLRERLLEIKERQKKSIPSRVFFNHFFAITYCISCNDDRFKLKKIPFYNKIKIKTIEWSERVSTGSSVCVCESLNVSVCAVCENGYLISAITHTDCEGMQYI